jgi:hypothetical protein
MISPDASNTAFVISNINDFAFLLEVRIESVFSRNAIPLASLDGNPVNVRECGELGALAKVPGFRMRTWQREGR